MNQRDQYIKQYSYVLGYLTSKDIEQIEQNGISVEEYLLKVKELPQLQYGYLKLLLIKHILFITAQGVVQIPQQEIETAMKANVENIKKNAQPEFGSLEKKIVQLPSLPQILKSVKQILPPQEFKILEFIIGQPRVSQTNTAKTRANQSTIREEGKKKDLSIPDILGDYKIQEIIGAGGMGKVFKAYHVNLERMVAIKVMLSQTTTARKRFLLEAKLTAKMQHPNIIPIHDIKTENNLDYIVMDFVQGKPLSALLSEGKLPFVKTMKIMKAIISAVAYAHSCKVIHRDLKPANILIEDNTERPLVMDFGLAKQIDDDVDDKITTYGQMLGSPRYMAPEQAEAQEVNHLADIYALGVIFYEMITGQAAINGGSLANVIYQITQQKYLRPRKVDPTIPIAVEKVCLKAMAKEKENRYQTAEDFLEALNSFETLGKTVAINVQNLKRKSPNSKTLAIRATQRTDRQTKTKVKKNKLVAWISIGLLLTLIVTVASLSGDPDKSLHPKNKIKKISELEKPSKEEEPIEKQSLKLAETISITKNKKKGTNLEVFKITSYLKDIREQKPLHISFRLCNDFEDIGLLYIQSLNYVIDLDLQGTTVSNLGLKYIISLKRLKKLNLTGTKNITNEGLQYIGQLKNLIFLNLDLTNIDDKGMHYLNSLKKSLKELKIKGTNITDNSIKILSSFTSLKSLEIQKTKISHEGFEKLRKNLPNCNISYQTDQKLNQKALDSKDDLISSSDSDFSLDINPSSNEWWLQLTISPAKSVENVSLFYEDRWVNLTKKWGEWTLVSHHLEGGKLFTIRIQTVTGELVDKKIKW